MHQIIKLDAHHLFFFSSVCVCACVLCILSAAVPLFSMGLFMTAYLKILNRRLILWHKKKTENNYNSKFLETASTKRLLAYNCDFIFIYIQCEKNCSIRGTRVATHWYKVQHFKVQHAVYCISKNLSVSSRLLL